MSGKKDFVIISTTIDNAANAGRLAEKIVQSRLAACVQYMPIQSIYRWKGNVEKAKEYLLLSKTKASVSDKLTAFIRKNHSYELPEIIISPVTGGLEKYLSWIATETKSGKLKSK
ncbi:MAG: divalent-cation tolerance protein CutA [Kiritimatiellae bacterium]|nr:divalent-cation tolerance protein CutA [Kiritimatiellia bacterium]MDD5520531.1 divalent-cation tolerance protein CutA [Kiritimatiellia bacterium]